MQSNDQLDELVRVAVYDHVVRVGGPPDPSELAARLQVAEADLTASYRHLAGRRALVLDADGAIAMAIPFSATPTDVKVVGPCATWWANSKA